MSDALPVQVGIVSRSDGRIMSDALPCRRGLYPRLMDVLVEFHEKKRYVSPNYKGTDYESYHFFFYSLLWIALPAVGALTDADLDKIRLIVKEEVKAETTALKQELRAEIAALKEELKEDIAKSEKNVKMYIDAKIEGLDKRLSTYNWVIYVLMPLIVVVVAIGVPTAIMAWRSGKDRSLERQVEILTQEVEALKQQRIVNP